MIPVLSALAALPLAHAEEPTPRAGHDPRVEAIEWAQPFELRTAHTYRHTATPFDARHGYLIQLAVDPTTQRARQIGVPNLWVGDHIAVRLNWDEVTGCSVVWVPRDAETSLDDLAKTPVFFGSTTLPERVDTEKRTAAHTEAARNDWSAVPVRERASESLVVDDFRAIAAVAADRIEACSGSAPDADRLDALRAK